MTPIIEFSALNSKLFSTITLQKLMSKLEAFHCFQQGQTICGWISGPALWKSCFVRKNHRASLQRPIYRPADFHAWQSCGSRPGPSEPRHAEKGNENWPRKQQTTHQLTYFGDMAAQFWRNVWNKTDSSNNFEAYCPTRSAIISNMVLQNVHMMSLFPNRICKQRQDTGTRPRAANIRRLPTQLDRLEWLFFLLLWP